MTTEEIEAVREIAEADQPLGPLLTLELLAKLAEVTRERDEARARAFWAGFSA